jgi:transcriptional regulator with PAS, ATPase and Fis domain
MGLIRACPGLAHIGDLLEKVGSSRAGNDTSVLIQGESGSGKEIVARAIHEAGQFATEPFMEINCAAVPETLLESELMGHEKGAFTDAKARKEGLFEMAGEGTIFLDEIGEMGVLLQSRLLRVIENRTFRRVGGKDELQVHARIVAATNRDLEQAIAEGFFRNDLYYRLQVVEVEIPPLRERPDDLGVLIDHFIEDFNTKLGLSTEPVDPKLVEVLRKYPWPGNVRELKNVLKRIMILEEPSVLLAGHFPAHIAEGRDPRIGAEATHGAGAGLVPLSEIEQRQILYTLDKTDNNKSKAARILGISRQTLREKLRQYSVADEPEADEAEA